MPRGIIQRASACFASRHGFDCPFELRLAPADDLSLFGRQCVIGIAGALGLHEDTTLFWGKRDQIARPHVEFFKNLARNDYLTPCANAPGGFSHTCGRFSSHGFSLSENTTQAIPFPVGVMVRRRQFVLARSAAVIVTAIRYWIFSCLASMVTESPV